VKRGTKAKIAGVLLLNLFACASFGGADAVAPTDGGPPTEGGSGDSADDGGGDAQPAGGSRLYVFGGGSSLDGGSEVVYSAPIGAAGLGAFQTEPATLKSARVFASSTSIDGTLVSLGGRHADGTFSDQLELFPPSASSWSTRSIGFFGAFYAIAAGNHRVFVFGGLTSDNAYDARLHVGDFTGGTPVWQHYLSVAKGRARAAAAFQGDTLYVAGGIVLPATLDGGPDPMNTVETGRFSGSSLEASALAPTAQSLLEGRQDHQLVVVAGHLFALGGFDGNNAALGSVEVSTLLPDGSPGAWASAANMPKAIGDFCAVATADAVFVVGGFTKPDGVGPVAEVYVGRYASGDLSWSPTTPLPVPLGGLGCAIR
jgi:hypothetical protein